MDQVQRVEIRILLEEGEVKRKAVVHSHAAERGVNQIIIKHMLLDEFSVKDLEEDVDLLERKSESSGDQERKAPRDHNPEREDMLIIKLNYFTDLYLD